MRSRALVACLLALAAAGCIATPPAEVDAAGIETSPALADATAYETKFAGKILAGAGSESYGHFRPEEDLVWPVSQFGFLLNLSHAPLAFEVRLTQSSAVPTAEWLVMLHSHKAHGTNEYVEHVTEYSTEAETCLRVPAADLTAGTWQVMVHASEDVVNAAYELTVTTWGVQGTIEPERHGHRTQDGGFQVDKRPIEACTGAA